jgi:dGTPase
VDWKKLLNPARLSENTSTLGKNDVRSEFDRDADRVLFSGAFRRLSRKTQVHPLAANDHVHNRLTHSLETGQVGRALGVRIYNEFKKDIPNHVTATDVGSIVQAACLAHDIGNPPFGHAGEEAMAHWFETNAQRFKRLPKRQREDLSQFDGNAQGFRLIAEIENHLFDGGMRLTYATLATFLKYPKTSARGAEKFSVFYSENRVLEEVADKVGLRESSGSFSRHPLAYLVEAADDICYCVLDLEDAVELKLLTFDEAWALFVPLLEVSEKKRIKSQLESSSMFRVNFTRIRGIVFRALLDGAYEAFMAAYDNILDGRGPNDLFSSLSVDDPRRVFINESKRVGRGRIYKDAKKVEVELGAFATLDILLNELCTAASQCAQEKKLSDGDLDGKSRLVIGLLGEHAPTNSNKPRDGWSEYLILRRAIDFVSGMTDNYATYLAKQISGNAFTGLQRP